jgi:hypothetical protein
MSDLPVWRQRFLARYGKPRTTIERVGFVLASACDEEGVIWISAEAVRLRMVAIWPELLRAPKRGRKAGGFSRNRVERELAAHPDWESIGQTHYPDGKLGPTIRLVRESVRREIGLPTSFEEAAERVRNRQTVKTDGKAAWLSRFPEPKWVDTSNPKTKTQRTLPKRRGTPVSPAAPDVARKLEALPALAPAALARVGDMTTLDELVVAAAERGLSDKELLRLLLGYRDGESAGETLARIFPLNEHLAISGVRNSASP